MSGYNGFQGYEHKPGTKSVLSYPGGAQEAGVSRSADGLDYVHFKIASGQRSCTAFWRGTPVATGYGRTWDIAVNACFAQIVKAEELGFAPWKPGVVAA